MGIGAKPAKNVDRGDQSSIFVNLQLARKLTGKEKLDTPFTLSNLGDKRKYTMESRGNKKPQRHNPDDEEESKAKLMGKSKIVLEKSRYGK